MKCVLGYDVKTTENKKIISIINGKQQRNATMGPAAVVWPFLPALK